MRPFSPTIVLSLSLLSCSTGQKRGPLPPESAVTDESELIVEMEQNEAAGNHSIEDVGDLGAARSDRPIEYQARTEIHFEDLDVSGELVKPQGALLLDRKKGSTSAPSGAGLGSRGAGTLSSAPVGMGRGGGGNHRQSPPARMETDPQAARDSFTDHGVNPFTLVEQDALSTFSIDVDTASYAISRRYLQSKQLPPFQSVRVEEFVNSIDYSYESSTDETFRAHLEAMPDPFREGHHIVRVGIKAKEIPPAERPPIHLTFLVDVSGSMSSPNKLGLAQRSLHQLIDHLQPTDTVALATYAGRTARVLEPTLASERRTIQRAIHDLKAGGSTAMSKGIDLAYDMASASFVAGHENRVLILSDGDANVGTTNRDDLLSQIKAHADRGITLTTVGFGQGNYQDTLMEQLANRGDGQNIYIDTIQEAHKRFVEELSGSMITVARDTKIQVAFHPESVHAYRLIGYENRDIADVDFRNDRVDAGEVGSGHDVTALYQVVLRENYGRHLATVRVRWEKPGPDGEATERSTTLSSRAVRERADLASIDLRMAYGAASFAEVLRQSPYVSELSMSQLIRFTQSAVRDGQESHEELVALMEMARDLGVDGEGVAGR